MSDASCDHRRARGGWWEDATLERCAFPIGPRNTWSNLAYVGAGLTLLAIGSPPATVMAGSLVVLGIGSGLYHGYKTIWANRLDHVGMYLTFGALSVHGIAPFHPTIPYLMITTGILLAVLFSYVIPGINLDVQMGLLLWYAGIPAFLGGHANWAVLSMAIFLLGFVAWQMDKHRLLVGLWGHAIWHIATAVAIALMFMAQGS